MRKKWTNSYIIKIGFESHMILGQGLILELEQSVFIIKIYIFLAYKSTE